MYPRGAPQHPPGRDDIHDRSRRDRVPPDGARDRCARRHPALRARALLSPRRAAIQVRFQEITGEPRPDAQRDPLRRTPAMSGTNQALNFQLIGRPTLSTTSWETDQRCGISKSSSAVAMSPVAIEAFFQSGGPRRPNLTETAMVSASRTRSTGRKKRALPLPPWPDLWTHAPHCAKHRT